MDWLKTNAWALVIALVTLVTTFSLYGYRINALEAAVTANQTSNLRSISKLNDQSVQVQVSLAKIQTDIEYIKVQIDKITK